MNFPWAICLEKEDAASLATLRLVAGIEVADSGRDIWLRGQRGEESFAAKLAGLPARGRYEWLARNQLRQTGQRVPSAQLPDLRWLPLNAWLQVELPVAALPAHEPRALPLRLVRSTDEHNPELLLTSLEEFSGFSAQAAQVRLDRLQFAASSDGKVLVRGNPSPPLPGRRFVLHGSVAVPAGYTWQPAVHVEALVRCFGVSSDALVLWHEDGTITRLHTEQFVPATRSAIRDTRHAFAEPRSPTFDKAGGLNR